MAVTSGPNEAETVIGVLYGVETTSAGGNFPFLDLIFTNRRIVGVVSDRRRGIGGLEGLARTYDPRELDALVAGDKHAFSFPFAAIEKARISGFVGQRALDLRCGARNAYLYFPKKEIPRVQEVLDRFLSDAQR